MTSAPRNMTGWSNTGGLNKQHIYLTYQTLLKTLGCLSVNLSIINWKDLKTQKA